ncbi:MAG: membrane protein [Anaerolineales bacterium]
MLIKPIRWNTFIRDFLRIEFGFFIFGISIAMMIRGNLGTSAWAVLEVALSKILGVTPGQMMIMMGFLVLSGSLILREQIGWGTLANILSIGTWEDFWLWIIPPVHNHLVLQSAMLLSAVLMMGIASAIYIGVDAGAGPRDSLMLAIKRTTGVSLRIARGSIEVTVVTLGWLLGGPVGIGTLVFALLIGPSVQWGFKMLHVHPHGPEAEVPQAPED